MIKRLARKIFVSWLMLFTIQSAHAEQINVAVAANFSSAFEQIKTAFKQQTGIDVLPSYASSGKLYTQIINGAPFELFLSADVETPQKLEQMGLIASGKRFTYAVGHLVLWSPQPGLVDAKGEVLRNGDFKRLAIANPKTAPYGLAAQQALTRLGLWEGMSPKLVQGESIAQAYQFISSGNAQLGFIAASQLTVQTGSSWQVPESLYDPIEQQAVILKSAQANAAALKLYDFLRSDQATKIITSFGYGARN